MTIPQISARQLQKQYRQYGPDFPRRLQESCGDLFRVQMPFLPAWTPLPTLSQKRRDERALAQCVQTLNGRPPTAADLPQLSMPFTTQRDGRWFTEPDSFQPERWQDGFEETP